MATKTLISCLVAILCLASQSYAQDFESGESLPVGAFCFEVEPLTKLLAAARIGRDVAFAYDRFLHLSGACIRAPRVAVLVEKLSPADAMLKAEVWAIEIEGRQFYALMAVRPKPGQRS